MPTTTAPSFLSLLSAIKGVSADQKRQALWATVEAAEAYLEDRDEARGPFHGPVKIARLLILGAAVQLPVGIVRTALTEAAVFRSDTRSLGIALRALEGRDGLVNLSYQG